MQTHAARHHNRGRYLKAALVSTLAFAAVLAALVVLDPAGRRDSAEPVTGSAQKPTVVTVDGQQAALGNKPVLASEDMVFIEENTYLPGEGAATDARPQPPSITRDEAADREAMWEWHRYLEQHPETTVNSESWDGILQDR